MVRSLHGNPQNQRLSHAPTWMQSNGAWAGRPRRPSPTCRCTRPLSRSEGQSRACGVSSGQWAADSGCEERRVRAADTGAVTGAVFRVWVDWDSMASCQLCFCILLSFCFPVGSRGSAEVERGAPRSPATAPPAQPRGRCRAPGLPAREAWVGERLSVHALSNK